MWTRSSVILFCGLAATSAYCTISAAAVANTAETVPTPAPAPGQNACPASQADGACDEAGLPQRSVPWWYWFHAHRGRQQHYQPPTPVPGNYYFRPYSLVQLRAQQEAVKAWGGDSRNPYGKPPKAANDVVKWPAALLDRRFAEHRDIVEAPYRRDPGGQSEPTSEDYQQMIGAVGRMKAVLGQIEPELDREAVAHAERFLDRLAIQARSHKLLYVGDSLPTVARDARPNPSYANNSMSPPLYQRRTVAGDAIATHFELTTIEWPPVLRQPQFAEQRAAIEAPFQTQAGGAAKPTVDDYRKMIEAAAQLKAALQQPGQGITPQECIDAEKFLGRLAAEARSQCVMIWDEQPDVRSNRIEIRNANPYANGGVFQQLALQQQPSSPNPSTTNNSIEWPAALRDARFAEQRAQIEAPYQRNATEHTGLTAADYEGMINAAEQMLKTMIAVGAELEPKERLEAEKCLIQLINEARTRAQAKASGETPEASDAPIIEWPAALRGPRFEEHRKQVEAPYRRNPKDGVTRTAADFQAMVEAAEQMKALLSESRAELSDNAYQTAVEFLDQLATEARDRITTITNSAANSSESQGPAFDVNTDRAEPQQDADN